MEAAAKDPKKTGRELATTGMEPVVSGGVRMEIRYSDLKDMALNIAASGLFGVTTPSQALALMLIAQGEGIHPAIAARDYHVIQGRPALKADALLARHQASGGSVKWTTYEDHRVVGEFSHPSGGTVTIEWTWERASAIKTWSKAEKREICLVEKDNWKNYARAMLRSRCISEGVRTVNPGACAGVYTVEEVMDFDDVPAGAKDADARILTREDKNSGSAPAESVNESTDRLTPDEVAERLDGEIISDGVVEKTDYMDARTREELIQFMRDLNWKREDFDRYVAKHFNGATWATVTTEERKAIYNALEKSAKGAK